MKIGDVLSAIDWSTEIPKLTKTAIALAVVLNSLFTWVPTDVLSAIVGVLYGSGLWVMQSGTATPEPTYEVKK